MKTLITLAFMFLATSCAYGGNSVKQQSPAQTAAPVGKGDLAPDFILEDQNGNRVKLSEAQGKAPVVLVFYRGYW